MNCVLAVAAIAHMMIGGIDQGHGAEYTRHCDSQTNAVAVRSIAELGKDQSRIEEMKSRDLGTAIAAQKCTVKKVWAKEHGRMKWHMRKVCKPWT